MINVLDKSIYNLISAGEVVERPASVVKELVENSIDAGATEISIDIVEGGKKSIRVVDNGSGILREDIAKAFLPHATSKISCAEDLSAIGTLGFRGEALSSISAVGRVTITSKTSDTVFGGEATICDGIMSDVCDVGFKDGTSILVEDLFYNVPARAKFLKSNRSEGMEVTALVNRLVLSNPNVSFKYSLDNNVVLFSSGSGLEDAILAVYGRKTVENLIKVQCSISDIVASGFIGMPEISRPTRSCQTLIINGRYVINSTVSKAVLDAYGTYLMKGQFPFYVLRLDIPLDSVDVNVHPNKLDVRFSDGNLIYKLVREAVSRALAEYQSIPTIDGNTHFVSTAHAAQFNTQILSDANDVPTRAERLENALEFAQTIDTPSVGQLSFADFSRQIREQMVEPSASSVTTMQKEPIDALLDNALFASSRGSQSFIDVEGGLFGENRIQNVGSIFNTYLILESGDSVYFLDQHASHERLLYDRYMANINSNNVSVQQLLVPYVFEVSVSDYDLFTENLETLSELGFSIESLSSRAFKISAVPAQLTGINLGEFVSLLSKDKSINGAKLGDIIKERVARNACRSAIKGGNALSEQDAVSLIKMFNKSQNLRCPHGRPIVIKIDKREIEKWFKRVV